MSDLVTTSVDDGPKIRVLICHTCKIVQPVPLWEGPAEHDELLMARVAEHQYPGSNPTRGHRMDLGTVPERAWDDPSKQSAIIRKIMEETAGLGQGAGLGDDLYDARGNYAEEAMRCWRIGHNRTADCGDYMSDKMTILADSRAERKDLGLDPKQRAKIKLCQFCPMHSVVMQRKNEKRFK